MHRIHVLVLVALSCATLTSSLHAADSAEERGLAIAREADRRDAGFGDYRADLEMILRNRQGAVSTRELRTRVLEQIDDGDRSLVIFDRPRDVKGTAFLTFSHKTGNDDQWLFMPALERVKRISSSNKSGPFMGSEFAYEDISSQEVEEYTYRYLRAEEIDGVDAFLVERVPVDPKSGYTRQLVWIDQDHYRTLQIEFYDRKGALLKTLRQSEFELYLGRHWRPGRMSMVNHQNGKSTELMLSGYVFGNGYDEADFDRASLARAR